VPVKPAIQSGLAVRRLPVVVEVSMKANLWVSLVLVLSGVGCAFAEEAGPVAPKPLYRDPVYDGRRTR